jgi:hypothetical protein
MSGSLTVISGTTTLTNVGTITLDSAGTLSSGGSSNATITGSVQVYLPGDMGTDSTTDRETSTIAPYDIASRTGSTVNFTWFENNSSPLVIPSTANWYLTPGRSQASTGSTAHVNVDLILEAAINFSASENVAIYFPPGNYELTQPQTLTANTTLLGAPGFQSIFSKAFTGTLFEIVGDNVFLQDIMVQGANATYANLWTNEIIYQPGGSMPMPDLFDWQTVSMGDLTGSTLTLTGGWQLSATKLPAAGETVLWFDELPGTPGEYTVEEINELLTGNYVLWNYTVVRNVTVSSVMYVELDDWNGYAVNLIADPVTLDTLHRDAFIPRSTSVGPVAQTISNPDYIPQQAFNPPFIQFVTGTAPYSGPSYYEGDYFVITGDYPTFRNVAGVGIVNGRTYLGQCRNPRFYNTHCLATFGGNGDAGFRFIGLSAIFDGCVNNSGDDGVQQSQQPKYNPYYLNELNDPASSTYAVYPSTWAERWIGCDITTTGSGRACAIVVNAQSNGDTATCPANAGMTSPTSVQFSESALSSALASAGSTLTALGLSGAPWVANFDYSMLDPGSPITVVSDSTLYQLIGGGFSGPAPGPSGFGTIVTGGTDGSNKCTWVSQSDSLQAASVIYLYDNTLSYTAPGAYVTGYTEEDGNVTVAAWAPTGSNAIDTAPFSNYLSGTEFVFLFENGTPASPPMVLTNSVDIQFERCTLRSVTTCVATVQNTDSFGTARAAFHGCTFDGSWSLDVKSSANPLMYVLGTPIANGGGCRVTVDGCRFYSPAVASFEASDGSSYINISRSELYPANAEGGGTTANVLFGGVAQLDFVENTVWGTQYDNPTYTAGVVTIGSAPTTYLGLTQSQTANNARITGNRFLGLYFDGDVAIPGLNIDYAADVLVSNNTFVAGRNGSPNNVVGIAITSNATNIISAGNIFSTCPVAYSGTLTQLSINGNEVYDVGASGYVAPPSPSYPGFALESSTWTPNLSCDMNPSALILNSVTYSATIVRTPVTGLAGVAYKNDIQFTISGSCTLGTASGKLRIDGLPYASASVGTQYLGVSPPISDFSWIDPTGVPVWAIQPSYKYMYLNYMKSGAVQSFEQITSLTSAGATFSLSGFGSYLSSD